MNKYIKKSCLSSVSKISRFNFKFYIGEGGEKTELIRTATEGAIGIEKVGCGGWVEPTGIRFVPSKE